MKSQLSIFRDIMRQVKGYFLIDLKESIKLSENIMLIRRPEVDGMVCTKGIMNNLVRNILSGFVVKKLNNNTIEQKP